MQICRVSFCIRLAKQTKMDVACVASKEEDWCWVPGYTTGTGLLPGSIQVAERQRLPHALLGSSLNWEKQSACCRLGPHCLTWLGDGAPHTDPETSPPTCLVLLRATQNLGTVRRVGTITTLQPLSLWTLRTAQGHLNQALGTRRSFLVGLGQSVFQVRLGELLLFYSSWLLGEQGWG